MIWNPNQNNQETDTAYAADSTRANGAVDPTTFLSILGNKAFNQWSTYLWALFTAFANKGFSTSDSSASTLVAQCANFLTTADVKGGTAVPFSSTPTLNCAQYNAFQITLTGNITLTVSNGVAYQLVTLAFTQDSVGGRTVTFPSNVLSPGTPGTAAGKTSAQQFMQMADGNFHPVGPMVVS